MWLVRIEIITTTNHSTIFHTHCVQPVFSSLYLHTNPSTHGVSRWPTGSAWEWVEDGITMTIDRTKRYTPGSWSSVFEDVEEHGTRTDLEICLEVMIKQDRTSTWGAVDGLCNGCWDSIHRLVNSQSWECHRVTVHLNLSWKATWWRSIIWGGRLQAESTFSGQLVLKKWR